MSEPKGQSLPDIKGHEWEGADADGYAVCICGAKENSEEARIDCPTTSKLRDLFNRHFDALMRDAKAPLEARIRELEAENRDYLTLIEEENAIIRDLEAHDLRIHKVAHEAAERAWQALGLGYYAHRKEKEVKAACAAIRGEPCEQAKEESDAGTV